MRFQIFHLALPMIVAVLLAGCGEEKEATADGRMLVSCGLPPISYLATAVGGDRVTSKSVLPEGRSPHDYSPGPGEIREVLSAKLFFTTGMNFENTVCRPINRKRTAIVDISEGVERISFDEHHHEECTDHDHNHGHANCDSCAKGHTHGAQDPHVWLSTHNAVIIAENIAKTFTLSDPAGATVYAANLEALKKELLQSQAYADQELAPYSGREFYVYHPAFGYFAKSVGLKQIGIELGGREATPAHLANVIKRAKADQIKVVFVQPQFNRNSARALGTAINGKVVGLDPLAADIPANIRAMTDALKEGFSSKEETE